MCFRTAPVSRAVAGMQSPALADIRSSLAFSRWSTLSCASFGCLPLLGFQSSPLRRLPWCSPLPAAPRFPASLPSAMPCQWPRAFRPRRFSRPRQLAPAPRLRACCIPLPTLGSVRFPVTSSMLAPPCLRLVSRPFGCSASLAIPVPAGLARCLASIAVLSDATTLQSFPRPRSRLLGHLRRSHFRGDLSIRTLQSPGLRATSLLSRLVIVLHPVSRLALDAASLLVLGLTSLAVPGCSSRSSQSPGARSTSFQLSLALPPLRPASQTTRAAFLLAVSPTSGRRSSSSGFPLEVSRRPPAWSRPRGFSPRVRPCSDLQFPEVPESWLSWACFASSFSAVSGLQTLPRTVLLFRRPPSRALSERHHRAFGDFRLRLHLSTQWFTSPVRRLPSRVGSIPWGSDAILFRLAPFPFSRTPLPCGLESFLLRFGPFPLSPGPVPFGLGPFPRGLGQAFGLPPFPRGLGAQYRLLGVIPSLGSLVVRLQGCGRRLRAPCCRCILQPGFRRPPRLTSTRLPLLPPSLVRTRTLPRKQAASAQ
jgi:hypothetical protein